MSKIDKLSILGIRSFDNQKSETIQFHSPLTLIVGYNGSGKTTIIECLKYATTGDLPPNSKGGAFIHDPKLCGEKEVLAQVKLSFKPTTDAKMVVTRSLQLSVKKTTRSQKTLEGQLLMKKGGERTAISSRVAELDQLLPQYLGVSKAILESVIFCHQDESLWPMSEPASLKKKFDEIFEALKYTKAIENIKQLRKQQNGELAKFKIMEEHAKENKDKADKAEKKSTELSDEIEQLRVEVKTLNLKAKDAGNKAQTAWNQVAKFTEVVELLKVAKKNQEWCQKHLDDTQKDLVERPEPDDFLRRELDEYEDRVKIHQSRQQEQANRYEDIKRDIDRIRHKQSGRRLDSGKYVQQKATHEQNVKDRENEIKKSAREHNIRGYDTELDDVQINEFMERITKLSKEQTSKVERQRRENAKDAQQIQEVLNDLVGQRSGLDGAKKAIKDQIAANDRKIVNLRRDVEAITIDEAGKSSLEAGIEDLEVRINKAKRSLANGKLDSKIKESNQNIQALENESETLNHELIQGTKQAGDLARLDHLKKEAQGRQRSLETMANVHGARLREIIGNAWDPANLDVDFQRVLDSKKRELVEAERQRDGVGRELEQIEFRLKTARRDVKKKEEELEKCAVIIREKARADPEDYPQALQDAQHDRDTRQTDVDSFETQREYFNKCIDIAKSENPACRLCSRAFGEPKEIQRFISRLEKQVSKAAFDAVKKELDELEVELKSTREAGTSYDTWVRLSQKELPALRTEVESYESQREALVRKIEDHDRSVKEIVEARTEIDDLSKPVATISRCKSEFDSYQSQIQELSSKQKDSGLTRTLEDIQRNIEDVTAQSKDLRSQVAKLQGEEQQLRDQISSLNLELGTTKSKLTTANHELEKRASINVQILELKESNKEQSMSLVDVENKLAQLIPRFSEEKARLEDAKTRGEAKERDLQREEKRLSETVESLMRADHAIRLYIAQDGPGKLAECQRDIEAFDKEIISYEDELKSVTKEINKIGDELNNQEQNKRIINDNLKYRKTLQELKACEEEIEQLAAQNAEADQEEHRREAEKWQRQYNLASTEETSKMGTMKAKDDQLMSLLNDWNTDYKDAGATYRKAHIQVETTKAAVEDLGRYGGALDKAIMKYHTIKMEEINRIIEELWKKTYQGTDVDTILIRSDNETGKGNRSYNYRVCMVKQDVEMDMRGRCSAGQKVLACIIIRLALAECFGTNCGLIALDEPTTNLDRDNIRSLAESLHGIIKDRQKQRNFQLIVITHDEEFLKYMKCADFCDYYWRVARSDRQKSIIERQSMDWL